MHIVHVYPCYKFQSPARVMEIRNLLNLGCDHSVCETPLHDCFCFQSQIEVFASEMAELAAQSVSTCTFTRKWSVWNLHVNFHSQSDNQCSFRLDFFHILTFPSSYDQRNQVLLFVAMLFDRVKSVIGTARN